MTQVGPESAGYTQTRQACPALAQFSEGHGNGISQIPPLNGILVPRLRVLPGAWRMRTEYLRVQIEKENLCGAG